MSQYGFSKGGDDGGGFFAGGSQQGSQGGGKSYQDESLRPVTIKQILDAEEAFAGADFKIDGSVVTQITFVGQIRSIQPQHTNVTYKIDDGTGQIDVKKWIDAEKQQAQQGGGDDASAADPGCEVDAYVRVWGRLKSFSNKRHVGAHVIRPVADFNEVNYHMLEATYVHLFFTKGDPTQAGGAGGGAGGGDGDSMFVDGGAGYGGTGAGNAVTSSKLTGCSDPAKKVYNFINSSAGGNEGVHLNVITNQTGLSVRETLGASDELLGQGLIYTTVDDETWAILEY